MLLVSKLLQHCGCSKSLPSVFDEFRSVTAGIIEILFLPFCNPVESGRILITFL